MSAIIAGKYDECIFIQSLFLQLFQYLPYIIIDAAYHSSISCLGVGLRTIMFPCRQGGLWSEFAASVFVQIGLQVFVRYHYFSMRQRNRKIHKKRFLTRGVL